MAPREAQENEVVMIRKAWYPDTYKGLKGSKRPEWANESMASVSAWNSSRDALEQHRISERNDRWHEAVKAHERAAAQHRKASADAFGITKRNRKEHLDMATMHDQGAEAWNAWARDKNLQR